jgi:hypothetical protein
MKTLKKLEVGELKIPTLNPTGTNKAMLDFQLKHVDHHFVALQTAMEEAWPTSVDYLSGNGFQEAHVEWARYKNALSEMRAAFQDLRTKVSNLK